MARCKAYEWKDKYKQVLLEGWARDGLSLDQIAQNMGVARQTLYGYMDKYPDIFNVIKKGREVSTYIVENAMFKTAIGYDVEETRQEIDEKGKKRIVKIKRHIPANVTAQIFIMKNRRPEMYKDKPVVEEVKVSTDDSLIRALKNVKPETLVDDDDFLPSEEE